MKFGIDRLLAEPDLRKPLIGKRFTNNHELDEAFAGELAVESGGQRFVPGPLSQQRIAERPDAAPPGEGGERQALDQHQRHNRALVFRQGQHGRQRRA